MSLTKMCADCCGVFPLVDFREKYGRSKGEPYRVNTCPDCFRKRANATMQRHRKRKLGRVTCSFEPLPKFMAPPTDFLPMGDPVERRAVL